MKRFLTNIYDDEDIFDVPEEELEARKNKSNMIARINSQIQDNKMDGLTKVLHDEGFFTDRPKTLEEEIIEQKAARNGKHKSINRFRNLLK